MWQKFALFATILILCVFIKHIVGLILRRVNKCPPGLAGVPFFGSLFTVAYQGDEKMLSQTLPQFGSISMHCIGNTKIYTLNDYNLVKKIFNNPISINRPNVIENLFKFKDSHGKPFCPDLAFCNKNWYVCVWFVCDCNACNCATLLFFFAWNFSCGRDRMNRC